MRASNMVLSDMNWMSGVGPWRTSTHVPAAANTDSNTTVVGHLSMGQVLWLVSLPHLPLYTPSARLHCLLRDETCLMFRSETST